MNEVNPPAEAGRRILVAGATGYLGRYVVRALARRGWRVRALVRDEARLGPARADCDEVFVGEATRPETLAGLCDGCDAAFSSLGVRSIRGPTFWDVDWKANLHLVERAREAGVGHFVFVSVVHGAEMRRRVPQVEARERVVDALRAGGPAHTIIRPTGFFNDMAEVFEMARRGTVWVIGDGACPVNPIHGADLAEFIAAALDDPARRGRELPVGGPDILTMREIAELAFRALDRPARIRRVPAGVLRATAAVASPFVPNFASLLRLFAATAESDGVGEPTGTHHLADFFRALREPGAADDLRIGR